MTCYADEKGKEIKVERFATYECDKKQPRSPNGGGTDERDDGIDALLLCSESMRDQGLSVKGSEEFRRRGGLRSDQNRRGKNEGEQRLRLEMGEKKPSKKGVRWMDGRMVRKTLKA